MATIPNSPAYDVGVAAAEAVKSWFSDDEAIGSSGQEGVYNKHAKNTRKEVVTTSDGRVQAKHTNNLGMAARSKNASDANNNPSVVMRRASADNVPMGVYRYPLPNSDIDEKVPYMKIEGFKYSYDTNDALGNKNASGQRTVSVYLPLPNNMPVGISQTFEDYSNVFGKIVRATDGMDIDLGGFAQSVMDKFDDAEGRLLKDSGKVWALSAGAGTLSGDGFLNSIGSGLGEAMSYFRVNAGVTVNPMSQSSYIGTDKREHSFNFKMIPRNRKEAIECKKIIEALQWHSTGERNKLMGGLLINFPSVWNVSFYTAEGKEINGMLQIPDAFLAEVSAIYSPDTSGDGFRYTVDNDAFAYNLSLKFVEAQNLTRDDLPYIHQGDRLLEDIHPITTDEEFSLASGDFIGMTTADANGDDPNALPTIPPHTQDDNFVNADGREIDLTGRYPLSEAQKGALTEKQIEQHSDNREYYEKKIEGLNKSGINKVGYDKPTPHRNTKPATEEDKNAAKLDRRTAEENPVSLGALKYPDLWDDAVKGVWGKVVGRITR